jgi:hypothetical protein
MKKGSVSYRRWNLQRGYISQCDCGRRAQVWHRHGAQRVFPYWVQCESGGPCPPSRQFKTQTEAIRNWNHKEVT